MSDNDQSYVIFVRLHRISGKKCNSLSLTEIIGKGIAIENKMKIREPELDTNYCALHEYKL